MLLSSDCLTQLCAAIPPDWFGGLAAALVLPRRYHPDKNKGAGAAEATRKFQALSRVHNILSDESRRQVLMLGCLPCSRANVCP